MTASEISSGSGPRVADAGGAAVADEVEAELVQVLVEAGALEVLGDDGRARRERGLHPRLALEPLLDRLAGEKPGADHHRRVRGVGAAGDRGDHHAAVVELDLLAALELDHHRLGLVLGDRGEALALVAVGSNTRGLARLARRGPRPAGPTPGTTRAIASSTPLPSASAASGSNSASDSMNAGFAFARAIRSCGRFGPAIDGSTARRGPGRACSVKVGSSESRVVEHPLLARVGVDQLDHLRRPAGELEVAQRLAVDREDRAGRAELRRHVPDRRPVGEAERVQPGAEELDELRDDAALAQHLGDGEDEVGRGRALGQLAVEAEADHLRQQHRDRLAEHRRLGLDPADAPAEDAEPVDHRRVRVGADERVGVGLRDSIVLVAEDDLAQVLEVDLVADPGRRRDDAEVVERLLAPAQEGVALAVALVVAVGVDVEGAGVAEGVDLDGVVDHEVDRHERVDLRRIGAELVHRVAHRGKVDDRRHAGEVLHEHAGGLKRDLFARLGLRVPGRDRLDVLGLHAGIPALEAQRVLEQDLQRIRQPGDVELLLKRVEPEDLVLGVPHRQRALGREGIAHGFSIATPP